MKEIIIYEFQLREIIDALRLTSNNNNSSEMETCYDRIVTQAYSYALNAMDGKKDVRVAYGIRNKK